MAALDLWVATAEEWEAHVTACFQHNPMQCVTPVSMEPGGCSLENFAQGSLGGGRRARPTPQPSRPASRPPQKPARSVASMARAHLRCAEPSIYHFVRFASGHPAAE